MYNLCYVWPSHREGLLRCNTRTKTPVTISSLQYLMQLARYYLPVAHTIFLPYFQAFADELKLRLGVVSIDAVHSVEKLTPTICSRCIVGAILL